jgi:hypothetical protein
MEIDDSDIHFHGCHYFTKFSPSIDAAGIENTVLER